jgi:CheY-like chemotaxis protein
MECDGRHTCLREIGATQAEANQKAVLAVNQVLTFEGRRRASDFDLPKGRRKTRCAIMSELSPIAGEATAKRDAILVVDDERPILDMFAAALQGQFEVVTATSAREAEFNLRKKEFKVVVADHLMPGGNGMNFLVRCREEYPHMQRVLVTGYMKPEMLLRSVNEAALYRYLLKPVQMADLLRIVQDAVRAHDVAVKAG